MESDARANPVIRGIVVVRIAVVVDIADVRGRATPDGAEPPGHAINKKRRTNKLYIRKAQILLSKNLNFLKLYFF